MDITKTKFIIRNVDQKLKDAANYYLQNNMPMPNSYFDNAYQSNLNSSLQIPTKEPDDLSKFTLTREVKTAWDDPYGYTLPEATPTITPTNINMPTNKRGTAKTIISKLVSKGLTKEQAAGIAGNLFKESSFNTKAVGDNNTSYGIAQWHDTRWKSLNNFLKLNNYHPESIDGQVEYLWKELNTTHKNALDALRKTTNARAAAKVFSDLFERPKQYTSDREDYAEEFLKI